jgi:hypothetical protein
MYEENYKELGCAVAIQAMKDYFVSSAAKQRAIIKDLKSPWMELITGGASVCLAEKLKSNPKEIEKRCNEYERRM